jgi:multidrug efflux system membrane fusion protein
MLVAGAFVIRRTFDADRSASTSRVQASPAIPVQVASVTTADVPVYLNGLGLVQALNTVAIRSRVDGEIQKIAFDEGQIVKQGDLLVQIDPRPFQAALAQAVAKKAQDEATLASARADLERTRRLSSQDFASKQQLDQQVAAVNALQAQTDADEAVIDNARTQLGYTTISAPLSGRTGFQLIDQGNIVRATDTTAIVEITQIDPISVVFTAPEDQLVAINQAQLKAPLPVQALSPNGKEVLAVGQLTLVNNQVDVASGTIRLKAKFDNADYRLWPGLSVSTRLLLKVLKGVLTVPSGAIQRGPRGLYVYVVKPDLTVDMQPVEVGPITEVAVIEEGLKPGDRVVSAGHSRLLPGSRVEIAERSAAKLVDREP